MSYPQPVPIPDIPHDSPLTFEMTMFCYTSIALLLQYLNLYVIVFSLILLGRRLVWLLVREMLLYFLPVSPSGNLVLGAKYLTIGIILATLAYVAYFVVQNHFLVNILYLAYPASVYFILFGGAASPFIELIPGSQGKVKIYKDKAGMYRTNLAAAGGSPTSPELVRMEVAITKTDFNMRLKQVLFNTVISAYYSAFIPVSFAQAALSYEVWWVSQHTVLVFVG